MKRIASFEVNHDKLKPGMYTSRIDGDITTYDIRMVYPNAGTYIQPAAGHTFEHLFATYARNSKFADQIIYCGPMGCQTRLLFSRARYESVGRDCARAGEHGVYRRLRRRDSGREPH